MQAGSENMLGEGARVKVHSLVRAPEHNGVQGRTGAFDARTGRWSVLIDPDGRGLALKPAHLTLLCSRADCRVEAYPSCRRYYAVRCARPSHTAQTVWGAGLVLFSHSLERLVRAGTRNAAHSLCRRCCTVRGASSLLTALKVSGAGRRGFGLV